MKVAHWVFLLGFLTVATKWTNALPFFEQDNKKTEDSKEPMMNDVAASPKFQICGFRIKEAIEAVCGSNRLYRPDGRIRRSVIPRRMIRAAQHECCVLGCKTSDLRRYCAHPVEKPRSVTFKVFLQKLADFYYQRPPLESSEAFANTPDKIRVPYEEVILPGSEETSPEIVEEVFRANHQADGRPHRIVQQRKSLAGMQKVEREHGPEIAVIIPGRHF